MMALSIYITASSKTGMLFDFILFVQCEMKGKLGVSWRASEQKMLWRLLDHSDQKPGWRVM